MKKVALIADKKTALTIKAGRESFLAPSFRFNYIQLKIKTSERQPKKIIGNAGIGFFVLNHRTRNTTISREMMPTAMGAAQDKPEFIIPARISNNKPLTPPEIKDTLL